MRKMRINILFAALLIFSGADGWTQNSNLANKDSEKSPSAQEITRLMAKEFAPHVITLTRDIKVYHYFEWTRKAGPGREVPLKYPLFQNLFRSLLGDFWLEFREEYNGKAAGPGMYAAIDPIISESYGNTMLEVTLKKGSKILDLSSNISFSSTFTDKLNSFVQDKTNSKYRVDGGFSTFTLQHFAISNRIKNDPILVQKYKNQPRYVLGQIFKQMIKEQKITAIAYSWISRVRPTLCTNDSRQSRSIHYRERKLINLQKRFRVVPEKLVTSYDSKIAVILIGQPSSVKEAKEGHVSIPSTMSAVAVTDTPGELRGEKRAVYERVQKMKKIISDNGSPVSEADKKLFQDNIFGCDERYIEE
jgi:hypothetical protein